MDTLNKSHKYWAVLLAAGMLAACSNEPEPSLGVEPAPPEIVSIPVDEQLSEGQTMAEGMCATCHAIGPSGDSPHASAPPFHTLSEMYPVATLAEAFAEGIIVGHPDMPVFQFEPRNIDSLLAYIESVQPVSGGE